MSTRMVFGRPMTDRTIGAIIAAAVVVVLVVVGGIFLVSGHSHKATPTTPSSGSPATSSGPPTGSPTGGSTALATQFRMGAVASNDQTAAGRTAAFDALETSTNVDLSIVHVFRGQMTMPIGTAADQQVVQAIQAGKTLLISWAGGDTREMAAGKDDALIAQRAREVAALKVPVLFEYRWEMDRPNLAPTVHSAADYIAAWKHVRTIFAAQKATNAEFVWCPQATGFANGTTNATSYYPGDDSVDWLCADLYPPTSGGQVGFAALAAPFLAWAAQHDKPIIFGEFGVPKSYGSARAAWLAAIKPVVQQHPKIRALVYFNAVGTYRNYSLNDDPSALAALGALGRGLGVKAAH